MSSWFRCKDLACNARVSIRNYYTNGDEVRADPKAQNFTAELLWNDDVAFQKIVKAEGDIMDCLTGPSAWILGKAQICMAFKNIEINKDKNQVVACASILFRFTCFYKDFNHGYNLGCFTIPPDSTGPLPDVENDGLP